jgi:hypothetical protein
MLISFSVLHKDEEIHFILTCFRKSHFEYISGFIMGGGGETYLAGLREAERVNRFDKYSHTQTRIRS